jgi:hypothetical protein
MEWHGGERLEGGSSVVNDLYISHTHDLTARLLRPVTMGSSRCSRPILDRLGGVDPVRVALDYSSVDADGLGLEAWRGPYSASQVREAVEKCGEQVSPRTRMEWQTILMGLRGDDVLVWCLLAGVDG